MQLDPDTVAKLNSEETRRRAIIAKAIEAADKIITSESDGVMEIHYITSKVGGTLLSKSMEFFDQQIMAVDVGLVQAIDKVEPEKPSEGTFIKCVCGRPQKLGVCLGCSQILPFCSCTPLSKSVR